MDENDKRDADMAPLLDLTPQGVGKIRRGDGIPRRDTMTRIFEITNGEVSPDSFYDLPAGSGGEAA